MHRQSLLFYFSVFSLLSLEAPTFRPDLPSPPSFALFSALPLPPPTPYSTKQEPLYQQSVPRPTSNRHQKQKRQGEQQSVTAQTATNELLNILSFYYLIGVISLENNDAVLSGDHCMWFACMLAWSFFFFSQSANLTEPWLVWFGTRTNISARAKPKRGLIKEWKLRVRTEPHYVCSPHMSGIIIDK